jgi:hypothetical protein
VIVGCCNFPFLPNLVSYSVQIGGAHRPPTYAPIYVEWKNKNAFDNALARLRRNPQGNGRICICVLEHSGGTPYRHKLNNDCPSTYECPSEKIRTVKVTKARAAQDVAAAGSAANDPNITYRIQSADPNDISAVLDTLQQ